ncbi:MAG: FIST C-terminal domain-containing protein [Candidatus Rokubacteria bacterium]|nr:FIST C-terminal domain-containing protein [Candidatus Rokubacteria bacterium]
MRNTASDTPANTGAARRSRRSANGITRRRQPSLLPGPGEAHGLVGMDRDALDRGSGAVDLLLVEDHHRRHLLVELLLDTPEDLSALLESARKRLGEKTIFGGCLCCCNGRGARLFGRASHDATAIQDLLGPFGLAGFFCNGEIGPVGDRSFLHGYTASLALFLKK